jgi:NifU-like protein involved in Fe-S cluster formation
MTAVCREACCSVTPRLTVSELFERGFRRNRNAPLLIEGAAFTDADGNTARFSVDVKGEAIAGVSFHASTCATLIAYCEYLAEVTPGFRLDIATAFTAASLVEALPGVPALKRTRAALAVAAFRATLAQASEHHPSSTEGSR